LAVLSLVYSGTGTDAEYAAATAYLRAAQKADGSWSPRVTGQQTATVTALVARAVLATGLPPAVDADANGVDDLCDAAKAWLAASANADGGWGVPQSAPSATAEVLTTLRWLGLSDTLEQAAVGYLAATRQTDATGTQGFWASEAGGAGDPWTTGLAIQGLSRSGVPNLAFTVSGATFSVC
jgi:hypothetical protein